MDDHDATATALAARLHLSRFHADRLVRAATGEPPAALRRRVLLERAAYRLVTTDHDVLRVAVEAGYASNEAFTRAFTRAFGRPPSRWRTQPTAFRLDAPSQVHFIPPGGLRVPAHRKVTAMDLLTRMVEHHVWLVGELVDRCARLTPEQLEAPSRDLGGRRRRRPDRPVAAGPAGRADGDVGRGHPRPAVRHRQPSGPRPWRRSCAQADGVGPAFLDQVRAVVDDGRLDETFVDATCEPPEIFTYGGMVAHVLTFAAHRRVLVCGALSDAGITDLGAGDPMHWVAQPA